MSGREHAGTRITGRLCAATLLAFLATGAGIAGSRASRTVVEIGHLTDIPAPYGTPVIANGRGVSLYMSTGDHNGRSSCYGKCTKVWSPYIASGKLVAGNGVNAKRLGKTRRRNGTYQVTYNRHPLYLFVRDKQEAGAWDGEGCDSAGGGDADKSHAHWWLLTARGYANKNESNSCQVIYQGVSG